VKPKELDCSQEQWPSRQSLPNHQKMKPLRVYDLLKKRVLVTRASARTLHHPLAVAVVEGQGELILDFSGVEGLTPSFLDELLTIIGELVTEIDNTHPLVKVLNAPTGLSLKFAAVARGHGLTILERDQRAWLICQSEESPAHKSRKV